MTVVLAGRVVDTLRAAADRHAPDEACGLLLGARGSDWVVESATVEGPMAADSFAIPPSTLLGYASNPRWIGVWHSHPSGPARLSATDRRGAAAWPHLLSVLMTPAGISCFAPHTQGLTPLPWRFTGQPENGRVLRSGAP